MGTAASTANLLDDVEGHAYGKECCARLCWVCWAWQAGSMVPHHPRAGSGVNGWQKYPCGPKASIVFWEKLPKSHWEFSL